MFGGADAMSRKTVIGGRGSTEEMTALVAAP